MTQLHTTLLVTRDGQELDVEIRGDLLPYRPARTSGPPEQCSPAEGGYVEDVEATLNNRPFELTVEECELAKEKLATEGEEPFVFMTRRPLEQREKMLEFITRIADLADSGSNESEPAEMQLARRDLAKIATRLGDVLGREERKAG